MKKNSNMLLILFLGFSFAFNSSAQDSLQYLSPFEFYRLVLENHPVAKQAALLSDQAKQEILAARGGFDPKISSTMDNKLFKGTEYYKIWQNSLKIPIWLASDLKFGYDRTSGIYLNPERNLPDQGLAYAGINIAVGQGLFIDERRAALKQARLLQHMNEAEKTKVINKLILDAAKEYWEWYYAYQRYYYIKQSVDLARVRYEYVKKRIQIGEEAPIDSSEAVIYYQNRLIYMQQTQLEYTNARLRVSTYLWTPDENPVDVDTNVVPIKYIYASLNVDSLVKILQKDASQNHPELIKLNLKIQQINIEKRLATEYFKPGINLNYNVLWPGSFSPLKYESQDFSKNYKAGFEVYFPLLFRKERAKFQSVKIKLQQTRFERNFTSRYIQNTIYSFKNELEVYGKLLINQQKLIGGYNLLREGEVQKFDNGESSIFMVNARENSLLDAQVKLAELESKYEKARASLIWSAGSRLE